MRALLLHMLKSPPLGVTEYYVVAAILFVATYLFRSGFIELEG
jgi:hypothetical protein